MTNLRRSLTVAVLGVATAFPASASAGLLDWLFPLRDERQAQRWAMRTNRGYPVTVGYGGYNVGTTFGSSGYYPTYGVWGGSNPGAVPTVVGYAPNTSYQTLWSPVEVTTFSPVAGGSSLQPCTSFAWQAQRAPYTAFSLGWPSSAPSACGACAASPVATTGMGGWQPVAQTSLAPATATTALSPWSGGAGVTDAGWVTSSDWAPSPSGATCASCQAATASPMGPSSAYESSTSPVTDAGRYSDWQVVGQPTDSRGSSGNAPADQPPRLDDGNGSGNHETYVPANGTSSSDAAGRDRGDDGGWLPDTDRWGTRPGDRYTGYAGDPPASPQAVAPSINNARDFERSRAYRSAPYDWRHDDSAALNRTVDGRQNATAGYEAPVRQLSDPPANSDPQQRSSVPVLRPIPDPDRQPWRIQPAPELSGPRDRTALLSKDDRARIVPAANAVAQPPAVGQRPNLSLRPAQPAAPPTSQEPQEGWRSMRQP